MSDKMTEKQAVELLNENKNNIIHIPLELWNQKLANIIIDYADKEKDGDILVLLLKIVPQEFVPRKVIELLIEHVKIQKHNDKLQNKRKEWLKGGVDAAYLIQYVKKINPDFWTDELTVICHDVVKHKSNGSYLQYVPEERMTQKMCIDAVNSSSSALEYVPDHFKTKEMCLKAVKDNFYKSIKFVPLSCLCPEIETMINEKLENDNWLCDNFQRIPAQLKTKEICLAAIKKQKRAFSYIPKEALTSEIYLEAVKNDESSYELGVFSKMPEEFKTREICLEVVKKTPEALKKDIPKDIITEEICLEAVTINGYMLEYVPQEFMTAKVCIAAIKQTPNAFNYIPEHLRKGEILEAGKSAGFSPKLKAEDINTKEKHQAALNDQAKNLPQETQDMLKEHMRTEVKADEKGIIEEHKKAVTELVNAIYPVEAVRKAILGTLMNNPGSGRLDYWENTRKSMEETRTNMGK